MGSYELATAVFIDSTRPVSLHVPQEKIYVGTNCCTFLNWIGSVLTKSFR